MGEQQRIEGYADHAKAMLRVFCRGRVEHPIQVLVSGEDAIDAMLTVAAERERALREDNERLRSKCNRLADIAVLEWEAYYNIALHKERMPDAKARRYADSVTGLHDDDLDPEPHGAASEGEG